LLEEHIAMNAHRYIWRAGDTLVGVAGTNLAAAGYDDVYTLITDIYAANPTVLDYFAIPPGSAILIPYKTG